MTVVCSLVDFLLLNEENKDYFTHRAPDPSSEMFISLLVSAADKLIIRFLIYSERFCESKQTNRVYRTGVLLSQMHFK